MVAPQPAASLVLNAGFDPINTVVLPAGKGDGGCGIGGSAQTWLSVATAAGKPPIITVGHPGPAIRPAWLVISVIRAANAIYLSVNIYHSALQVQRSIAVDLCP